MFVSLVFLMKNGNFAFWLWSLIEATECSPGLNLSPHNFVSLGGCLAKNEFLNSQRCQCSSKTGLRKSKNTNDQSPNENALYFLI